jgi:hypothetical protein
MIIYHLPIFEYLGKGLGGTIECPLVLPFVVNIRGLYHVDD